MKNVAKSGLLQNLQKINPIDFNIIWLQMQHFVHWEFFVKKRLLTDSEVVTVVAKRMIGVFRVAKRRNGLFSKRTVAVLMKVAKRN